MAEILQNFVAFSEYMDFTQEEFQAKNSAPNDGYAWIQEVGNETLCFVAEYHLLLM